jgi:hypothetical protein
MEKILRKELEIHFSSLDRYLLTAYSAPVSLLCAGDTAVSMAGTKKIRLSEDNGETIIQEVIITH